MKLMDNKAVINAMLAANIDGYIFIISPSEKNISKSDKEREAKIIGIDKSIENLTAFMRSNWRNLAPVMVTPALLAPGIKAITCHKPMINDSRNVIFFQFFLERFVLSAKYKIMPNIKLEKAITLTSRK